MTRLHVSITNFTSNWSIYACGDKVTGFGPYSILISSYLFRGPRSLRSNSFCRHLFKVFLNGLNPNMVISSTYITMIISWVL